MTHRSHKGENPDAIKNYVLDTNVILHDPYAVEMFEDNNVFLPITVVEETDKFKRDMNTNGRNARTFARLMDALREQGSLQDGVKMQNGGTIHVILAAKDALKKLPQELSDQKADNLILAAASSLREHSVFGANQTVMVTKDINLRLKADAIGLVAQDFEHGKVDYDDLYTGLREAIYPDAFIDMLHRTGDCDPPGDLELHANEYVLLRSDMSQSKSAMARYDLATRRLRKVAGINKSDRRLWGLHPKNVEQQFACDALLNDDIKLVTLVGKAGTGKTLLAIASGLAKTADENVYTRLLVSRPVFPMGKDIGFLPGDIEEKLAPWMQPIYDNVDFLLDIHDEKGGKIRGYQELQSMGVLQIEALTYIRGRSIPKQFMIVDEAQNLTPHEIKTIITRAGMGTKIVLTGDPNQIDNPYIDACSNGLTYIVERMREHPIAAHITLTKGERSPLAELAANIL